MKVKALFTGFKLTEGRIYEVINEYYSVYEIRCDDGRIYCRAKEFFEIYETPTGAPPDYDSSVI